jgi:response regulator of citrate/malate metabolism
MATRRERIIELGAIIAADRAQLQTLRERLRANEAEFDRLLRSDAEESALDTVRGGASNTATSVATLGQRCVDMLDATPGERFTAEQIASAVGSKVDTIRSTLARLADHKRIVKVERGLYKSVRAPEAAPALDAKEGAM